MGLSPRVRGHLGLQDTAAAFPARSIPACAGAPVDSVSSLRSIPACAGAPDNGGHDVDYGLSPRVRGHLRPAETGRSVDRDKLGLSPRVRGHLEQTCRGSGSSQRSIPACAGAPRRYLIVQTTLMRSIPACAGAPGFRQSPPYIGQAGLSPRVRGHPLTWHALQRDPIELGLSPRVRGHRYWPDQSRRCKGSIPACAGA